MCPTNYSSLEQVSTVTNGILAVDLHTLNWNKTVNWNDMVEHI